MATRKTQMSVFVESSALIPMLDSENALQKRIVAHLSAQNALISIDTVVLSEYLAGLGESVDKSEVVERLSRQFRVHTFDAHSATVCAEVFKTLKDKGQIPRNRSERQITKADIMIMASAIVSGAAEFLFNDGHFAAYPAFLPSDICGHKLPTFVRWEMVESASVFRLARASRPLHARQKCRARLWRGDGEEAGLGRLESIGVGSA